MNNKGQISMELLLYLVVITIIMSLIIFTLETVDDNQVTRINNKELTNILDDTLETLIKDSGTPYNWEKLDNNQIRVIGLKSNYNNKISYEKLIKLKNNNQLFNNYFPDGISYELTLSPKYDPKKVMTIAGSSLSGKKQILSKSEVVLLDYGYNITQFTKHNKTEECYYNHDSNWTCISFTISKELLNEGTYYIITNLNIEYILSNTYSENITDISSQSANINNQLKQLIKDENETIQIHINNPNSTYIVYDKNNKEQYLKNVIEPEIYILTLKIAS